MSRVTGKQNAKQYIVVAVCWILFWLFAYRNMLNLAPIAWGDIPQFPAEGAPAYLREFVYTWQLNGLGYAQDMAPSRLVLAALIALFGNQSILAQKFFILLFLPLAFLSFYFSASRLIPSRLVRFITAWLFVANPFAIGQFVGGGPGVLLCYALVPILAFCLERLGEENGLTWALVAGIVIAVGFAFYLSFITLTIPLLILPGVALIRRGIRHWVSVAGFIFLGYLIGLLLNLPLTFPLVQSALGSVSGTLSALRPGTSMDSLLGEVQFTYRTANPLGVLRLETGVSTGDYWLGYRTPGDWFNLLGFIIPWVAFGALLFSPRHNDRARVLGYGSVALVIVAYIFLIQNWGPPRVLFERIPLLFSARNPVPFMVTLAYAMFVLFGLALNRWIEMVSRSMAIRNLSFACVLAGLAIFAWPMFVGDLGIGRIFDDAIYVPRVYEQIGEWAQTNGQASDKILLLPYDNSSRVATGLLRARVIEENVVGSRNAYAIGLLKSLTQDRVSRLASQLAPLGVRYVIVNLASPQQGEPNLYELYGIYLHGDARAYQAMVERQPGLSLVYASPDFAVYENTQALANVSVFASQDPDAWSRDAALPVDVRAISPVEYRVTIPAQAKTIMLSESFDVGWSATVNGCSLARLENPYGINSFLVSSCPRSDQDIILEFLPQRNRNVLILCLGGAWGSVLIVLTASGPWARSKRRVRIQAP